MSKQPFGLSTRAENERLVSIINAAWGEKVAWLETTEYTSGTHTFTTTNIASKLVGGCLPGRSDVPPFFAGPVGR